MFLKALHSLLFGNLMAPVPRFLHHYLPNVNRPQEYLEVLLNVDFMSILSVLLDRIGKDSEVPISNMFPVTVDVTCQGPHFEGLL